MNDVKNCSMAYKALADENRLRILELLSEGAMCACEILKEFEFSQPALSQHMKILTESGFVSAERSGNWMYYSIRRETLENAAKILLEMAGRTDTGNKAGCEKCE